MLGICISHVKRLSCACRKNRFHWCEIRFTGTGIAAKMSTFLHFDRNEMKKDLLFAIKLGQGGLPDIEAFSSVWKVM